MLLNNGTSLNTLLGTWTAIKLGMPYVPRVQMVSVDINGEWRGLYYLADTVEANSNRIDISKNGIIVENDPYWWNGEIYFRIENQINPLAFTIKYPKEPSERQYQEIKNYFEYVFGLIQNDDPDSLLFIDSESFVRWVMIRDILRSGDSGGSNMYYVLDSIIDWENNNKKLQMMPAWDFDACLTGSESWYETMDSTWSIQHTDFITYFPELFKIKRFNDEYYLTWQQIREGLFSELKTYLFEYAGKYGEIIQEYRDKEQKMWDQEYMSFEDEVEYDLQMIAGQYSWIEENYTDWLDEGR